MVKFLFTLLIAVTGALAGPDIHYDLGKAEEYFQDFIQQYKKQYSSIEEKVKKFEVFKQSLQKYNKLNLENEHAEFGINKFADISLEEITNLRSVYRPPLDVCTIKPAPEVTPPESWDWRKQNAVTRVKDQDPCWSCWAFSATGNLEGQYAIKHGHLISFSEQQLMDCLIGGPNNCRTGSNEVTAFKYYMDGYGVMAEEDYPYAKGSGLGQFCAYDPYRVKVNVTGCEKYKLTSEYDVMKVLYERGPLSVSIDDAHVQDYRKGIIDWCPYGRHNHAVLLVGYGTVNNVSYWIYKNSWGQLWGEDGYFRVKRGINGCGLLTYQISTAVIE